MRFQVLLTDSTGIIIGIFPAYVDPPKLEWNILLRASSDEEAFFLLISKAEKKKTLQFQNSERKVLLLLLVQDVQLLYLPLLSQACTSSDNRSCRFPGLG